MGDHANPGPSMTLCSGKAGEVSLISDEVRDLVLFNYLVGE